MPESNTIHTHCPNCEKPFELDASLLGQKGKCDECDTKFIIEEIEQVEETPVINTAPAALPEKKSKGGVYALLVCALGALGGVYYYQQQQDKDAESTDSKEVAGNTDAGVPVEHEDPKTGGADVTEPTPKTGNEGDTDTASKVDKTDKVDLADKVVTEAEKPDAAPLENVFTVKEKFSQIDIRAYRKTYPNVHQGWMPSKKEQANEALEWGNHLGPLGVRIRSHAPQLQGRAAFAENVPASIRSQSGQLALTAAEVVTVTPNSPAEGHLKKGDLIIGIEGEDLVSGNKYRPSWEFMHKDSRELQLMLGEKIDQAQARGDIRLTVLRYHAEERIAFEKQIRHADGKVSSGEISVSEGDEVHLVLEPKGSNENDHFAWLSPQFIKSGTAIDLGMNAQIRPIKSSTGWGKITDGTDINGKKLGENSIGVHAPSTIVFKVPAGVSKFRTGMKLTMNGGDPIAKIIVKTQPQPLPVTKKAIWTGKGGNKSVPVQEFDIAVPGEGLISLQSNHFDNSIAGDGAMWMDVVLEGDYGTKKLLAMRSDSANAGYGRATFTTDKKTIFNNVEYDQVLNLHATGEAVWKLPKGTKRIKGKFTAVSYGKVQPIVFFTNEARPLTGVHKDKIVEVRFPIGKTGSFSSTYPKDCKKTDQMVTRHTEWIAAQQREDGSWPRLAGYTSDGWDTAWCALALMSSGNSKYDKQVRKAAYRVAYDTVPSEWIAERATRLILLGEYYLRMKDAKIIAGIQASYHQVVSCCKTDYMAGHKVNGFGYGIAGQHYGTGHMALALAMASRTPITVDKKLVDGVIRHAGEVCVNGSYAYGRGRRLKRDDSRKYGGGNAMIGPGMLGAQIGGGHASSIKEAIERWDATIGDGDNSHATSSLAYIFSSLAMASGNEEVYLKHMQNFKYKMTIDDNWEGGFLKSAFPLDFQGGEGVTSSWIRTSGYILVLNALKHNMAITGKKEYHSKERIQSTAVSEWGGQVHSYYLRNWCLAKELLGSRAPRSLSDAIKEMNALPRDLDLVPSTKKIIMREAPALIERIARNRALPEMQRAYAIELLCGLDFQIYSTNNGANQDVELKVNLPLHELNWLEDDKESQYQNSPFALNAKVEISARDLDKKLTFEIEDLKGFNLEKGNRTMKARAKLKKAGDKEFSGSAKISFKIGKTKVSYQRPLVFNTEVGHANHANLRRLKLKLRMAPRAIYQSQPLLISGIAFDFMYPKERMATVNSPDGKIVNIHEGDEVLVDVASENMICGWVHSLKFTKPTQVSIPMPRIVKATKGTLQGDWKHLYDHKAETTCNLNYVDGKGIIEFDYGKLVTLNGLDARCGSGLFRIWYHNGDTWLPLVWDRYSVNTSHSPMFPNTKAQRWRVEIGHGRGKKLETLRLIRNLNRVNKMEPQFHTQDSEYYPEIQPN